MLQTFIFLRTISLSATPPQSHQILELLDTHWPNGLFVIKEPPCITTWIKAYRIFCTLDIFIILMHYPFILNINQVQCLGQSWTQFCFIAQIIESYYMAYRSTYKL